MKKVWLSCSLVVWVLCCIQAQVQNPLSFRAINQHQFSVTNQEIVPLNVKISGYGQELLLKPGAVANVRTTREVLKANEVKVSFSLESYREERAALEARIKPKLPYIEVWSEIEELSQGREWPEIQLVLKEYVLSEEVIGLYRQLYKVDQLYAASRGLTSNEFSSYFEPFPIRPFISSSHRVTPRGHLEYGFLLLKSPLNEFWGKKSSRWSHAVTLSVMILNEKSLDESLTKFLSVYGFAGWGRVSFGLDAISSQAYYVGADYVKFQGQGFFPLQTTDNINLNFSKASAGAFGRFYNSKSGIFFDLGLGYDALVQSTLQFDSRNQKDTEKGIIHLAPPNELTGKKYPKVADSDVGLGNRAFAMGKAGFTRPGGGFSLSVSGTVSPPANWLANEDYQLYYVQDSQGIELVPMDGGEEQNLEFQLRIHVGLSF